MVVLVVTAPDDPTATRVCHALSEHGADWERMDLGEFPDNVSFSATGPGCGWQGSLRVGDHQLSLAEIGAVYYRRPTAFRFPEHLSVTDRRFAAAEARQGLGGVLSCLAARFVNHPSAVADAALKPVQLRRAAEVGFRVPPTLITSVGAQARAFTDQVGGRVIYKPLGWPILRGDGKPWFVYATLVTADDLDDESVRICPVQLQRFIEKRHDVRLTAVGAECFAAIVHADSDRAYVDWRADYASLRYEPTTAPQPVTDAVRRYLKAFGLVFGCFDFSVGPGPDGPETWWFLECGANAQWGWIAHETGMPIADAIARQLLGGTS